MHIENKYGLKFPVAVLRKVNYIIALSAMSGLTEVYLCHEATENID